MKEQLEPERAGLEPASMGREPAPLVGRVVGGEQLADLVDRDLEVTKPGDRPSPLELLPAVVPVAGESIDLGRPEQVQLVVVAQGADTQPGQSSEAPDREQVVIHVRVVDPRAGRESRG